MKDQATEAAAIDLTWVGHATSVVDVGGVRVITDPLLTSRVAHLRRRRAAPSPDVYDVDVVLLSHVHIDHMHPRSLKRIRSDARIITPKGSGILLRKAGFSDVVEVVIGDKVPIGPGVIEVVNADHHHGRGPHSRVSAKPVGYVIDVASRRIYFAGDTDLFPEMADINDIDLALMPIWGWGSTIGTGHLDPNRAVDAMRLIKPELIVPIHWGTYSPEDGRQRIPKWFDSPRDKFIDAVGDAGESSHLQVIEPNQLLHVAAR